jgi:hypothetical protein
MTMQLPLLISQRWHRRRSTFIPPTSRIDVTKHGVEPLDTKVSKAFVIDHHYSASYPSEVFTVGLFRSRPFERPLLVGAAVFSVPTHQAVIPHWTGLSPHDGCLLGRFVLTPEVEFNGESWCLARAVRALRMVKPHLRVLLAYSDPVPRRGLDGVPITPGHIGQIYSAFGGTYLGRGRARALIVAPGGIVVNERSLSKLRRGERGRDHVEAQLGRLGAPRRKPFEDGEAYVKRALRDGPFTRKHHRGCHVFAWALNRDDQVLRATLAERALPRPLHPDPLPL